MACHLFLVSLHVVGIESEYFVYTRYHTYVCEMNLVCAYHATVVVYPVQHACLSQSNILLSIWYNVYTCHSPNFNVKAQVPPRTAA